MDQIAYQRLRRIYAWPENRPLSATDAFEWSLDAGGRDLVKDFFDQIHPSSMVEVGSFMGGSALRWLRDHPNLSLVCVDPFSNGNLNYVNRLVDTPWAQGYGRQNMLHYAELLAAHGTLAVVQNNLWDYRDRVVLVNGRLQDKVQDLRGLEPDVTFLDAMKVWEEFDILDSLFPRAAFIGDDWSWADAEGNLPVQEYAGRIAARRHGTVYAKAATFVIAEPHMEVTLSRHWKVDYA